MGTLRQLLMGWETLIIMDFSELKI